jgi:hypothetical protein
MGRDGLVGIATVPRISWCARYNTLIHKACGPTRNILQRMRVIFSFEQWRSQATLTHLRGQRTSKTIPVLPV